MPHATDTGLCSNRHRAIDTGQQQTQGYRHRATDTGLQTQGYAATDNDCGMPLI